MYYKKLIFLLCLMIPAFCFSSSSESFTDKKILAKKKRSRSQLRQSVAETLENILHQFLQEIDQMVDLIADKKYEHDFQARYQFLSAAQAILQTGKKRSDFREEKYHEPNKKIIKTAVAIEHEIAWRLREFVDEDAKGPFMALSREQLEVLDDELQRIQAENERWLSKLPLFFHESCDRIKK